jgi:hypothetical protein
MIRLGCANGYKPIGVEQHEETENNLAIRFGKSLTDEPMAGDSSLFESIARGEEIVGLMRDPATGQLKPLFRSEVR